MYDRGYSSYEDSYQRELRRHREESRSKSIYTLKPDSRPPFVPPSIPTPPAGCAGFVRKFRKKGDGYLRNLIDRLEDRADRGGLNSYQLLNDERQRNAARFLLNVRQERHVALSAYLANSAPRS